MRRRTHLAGLLALAMSPLLIRTARATADPPVPPEGICRNLRHLSYTDQGGRPDGVQIMVNRNHVYVGHMFSDGVTILDAHDPSALKPVGFFTAGAGTRTHHLQVSDDLLLLANGANIVAMQSYDSMRGYFENSLADSVTGGRRFRSGLSIHDISKPHQLREIAFLEMPGLGVNRLWWTGGRYAYVSAHFDGFVDHVLCIVDLNDVTRPEIVSRWWLPGMHREGGETPTWSKGRRVALHHMITAGDLGYGAWRDGGFTIHDIRDPANPRMLSHVNWSPPHPGGTHTPLPLPGRKLAVVADEANAEQCAKGIFHTQVLDIRSPQNPMPLGRLPTPDDRDYCSSGVFGPHNLHENRPGSFQSEDLIFATYNNAGVRVFDIGNPAAPREIASWVPPQPTRLIDPRPKVSLAPKTCDAFVTRDGVIYVSDWNAGMHVLEFRP